jgi:hypothetical protein
LKKIIEFLLKHPNKNIGFSIYKINDQGIFEKTYSKIPRKLRLLKRYPFQLADPFIFIDVYSRLWCFFEEKSKNKRGTLSVLNLESMETSNLILNVNCHLSFPYVFHDNGNIYLLPETEEIKEVALYYPVEFPTRWLKYKVLLKGSYVDSHIFKKEDIYYLFTTLKKDGNYMLQLFTSNNIEGPFKMHKISPLKTGRKFGRSGGAIWNENGELFRLSQDCEFTYGREVHKFRILKINEFEYQEELIEENIIYKTFNRRLGGHHISRIEHSKIGALWAVDMNLEDSYFQRFVDKLFN